MIRDLTKEETLFGADNWNIPMNCCYFSPEEHDGKHWLFEADNYMPRKGYAIEGFYKVEADSKGELVEYVSAIIVPIYNRLIADVKQEEEQ